MAEKVSAIVLAAGLSSRMGDENKLFLPYKNSTLLGTVIDNVTASHVFEVIVVTSPEMQRGVEQLSAYLSENIKVVVNEEFRKGMTTSVRCGVRSCNSESHGWMICLGDMPKITTGEYNQILDQYIDLHTSGSYVIVVPSHKGKKGNPVIFSSIYKDEILHHDQMEGCREVVRRNQAHVVELPMDSDHILTDVDTRQDYEDLMENW